MNWAPNETKTHLWDALYDHCWKPETYSQLVVYPHLNQGGWVSLLVHSQPKLDFVVGGGVQGQWKINIIHGIF